MIWAASIGAAFFREYPDPLALFELAAIITAGLITVGVSRLEQGKAA